MLLDSGGEVFMLNTCVICEHKKKSGVYLVDSFICDTCEHKLVSATPTDDYYQYCVKKLTNVRKSLHILGEQA